MATQSDARSVVTTYTYDSLNRVLAAAVTVSTVTYEHDNVMIGKAGAKGRLTKIQTYARSVVTTYTYDNLSRVLTAMVTDCTLGYKRAAQLRNREHSTLSSGITYVYDGRGRMKKAGVSTYPVNGARQQVSKATGSATYFAYDESGKLIEECDVTASATHNIVWMSDTTAIRGQDLQLQPAIPGKVL